METPFEEALTRLDKYIWYMAYKFGRNIKNFDIDDLHQEGMIKLYDIYSRYTGKTSSELDAIFKTALRNMLKDIYSSSRKDVLLFSTVPLEDVLDLYKYDAFLDVYLAYYKKHLNGKLPFDAMMLLDTILSPTPAAYHLYNIHVMRCKALQSQGFDIRVPNKMTHEILGKSLGFTLHKTKFLVKRIQKVWRVECQVKSKSKQSAAIS